MSTDKSSTFPLYDPIGERRGQELLDHAEG
jgi:hypothetical protein